MSNLIDFYTCLICSKKDSVMISLQEVLMGCQQFSVAEVLYDLNFINISNESTIKNELCFICVAKIQYCYEFKSLCRQTEQVLKTNIPSESIESTNLPDLVSEEFSQDVSDVSTEVNSVAPFDLSELNGNENSESGGNDNFGKYKHMKIKVEAPDICEKLEYGRRFGFTEGGAGQISSGYSETVPAEQRDHENSQLAPSIDQKRIDCSFQEENRETEFENSDQLYAGHSVFEPDSHDVTLDTIPNFKTFTDTIRGKRKLSSKDPPRNSSGKKIYYCRFCDKSFHYASYWRDHEVSHSNQRNFQCYVCEKSFKHRRNLTEHMRIHTGEKPFRCDTCSKGFLRSRHLHEHKLSHAYDPGRINTKKVKSKSKKLKIENP